MGVVVITGCSTGIGLETALAFGREGATVYATMRDTSKAGRVLEAAARDRSRIEIIELDVTDDASVTAAAEHILTETDGRVDVVVNNAGIGAFGAVEDLDIAQAQHIMDTNFWGPLRVMQAFVPAMRTRRSGIVVNVSSLSGRVPAAPCLGIYAASKFALGAISEALRYETAVHGIRVILIELGTHRTNVEANLPAVNPGSPYADLATRVCEATKQAVRVGADPADAAATIVAATHDPATPLHLPVGLDAEAAIAHYQEYGIDGWDQAMTTTFGVASPPG